MDFRSLPLQKLTPPFPLLPRRGGSLCQIASVLMLQWRFPKDVINVTFGCSETADISGSMEGRRNIILRVSTRHIRTFRKKFRESEIRNVQELYSFFYFCFVMYNLPIHSLSISKICLKGGFFLPPSEADANCFIKYCSPPNQMMSSPNLSQLKVTA